MVMEYQIVADVSDAVLSKKVNDLIKEGWTPLGGLAHAGGEGWQRCSQALVKYPHKGNAGENTGQPVFVTNR